MSEPQQLIVPTEDVLAVVEEQRNVALTEVARMRALAQKFATELGQEQTENARLTAEVERLRGGTPVMQGQVSDAG